MTSKETNKKIKEILDKYLSHEKQVAMFRELKEVEGNVSFKKSIENIFKDISLDKNGK
jgi:hypothetical protein